MSLLMTSKKSNHSNMSELTPEQIQQQEIRHTVSTHGWNILVEGFKRKKDEYENLIDDIDMTDELVYSQRTMLIQMKKMLRAFIEEPERLLKALESIESRGAK